MPRNNNKSNTKGDSRAKKIGKFLATAFNLKIWLILIAIIVLLAGAVYLTAKKESKLNMDDKKNVPAKATAFTGKVKVSSDGKINTEKTPKELWKELKKDESNITEYLDSAEDFSKLLNAQLVSQYMDTRPSKQDVQEGLAKEPDKDKGETTIDEDIDWKKLLKNTDSTDVQGIIKMQRRDIKEGEEDKDSTTQMTFVDKEKFDEWLEGYSTTESESKREDYKQKLQTHFTINDYDYSADGQGGVSYSVNDIMTDISQKIVDAAYAETYSERRILPSLCC